MERDLRVRLYCPAFVNELPGANMDGCYTLCFAGQFPSAASSQEVPFSDEHATYHSACDKNVVFWSKKNSNFRHELEYNAPHVMTSDYMIGPYCFDGPVNIAAYSAMGQMWLKPQLS